MEQRVCHSHVFVFMIIVLGTFAFARWHNETRFWYDAGYYWELSSMFSSSGRFSLLHIDSGFRGYFLPLLFYAGRTLAESAGLDAVYGLWLLAACTLGVLFTFLLPKLFSVFNGRFSSPWRMLLPWACTLFFWPGLVLLPLSDMYACVMMLAASVLAMELSGNRSGCLRWGTAFLLGFLLYAAYNTRTIYLFSMLFFLVPAWRMFKEQGVKPMGLALSLAVAGGVLAAIPQILINEHLTGTATPRIMTLSLFAGQLTWGIEMQNYLTLLGDTINSVRFQDPVGLNLLEKAGIEGRFLTMKEFVILVLSHPLEYAGIYLRHLAVYLNPVFGEVYIRDLYQIKIHKTLINYTLLWIFGIAMLLRWRAMPSAMNEGAKIKLLCGRLLYLFPVMLPCLAISLGAPELRFMFPLYLLLYGSLAYLVNYRDAAAFVLRHTVAVAAGALALLWVLASQWSLGYACPNVELPRMLTLW